MLLMLKEPGVLKLSVQGSSVLSVLPGCGQKQQISVDVITNRCAVGCWGAAAFGVPSDHDTPLLSSLVPTTSHSGMGMPLPETLGKGASGPWDLAPGSSAPTSVLSCLGSDSST